MRDRTMSQDMRKCVYCRSALRISIKRVFHNILQDNIFLIRKQIQND